MLRRMREADPSYPGAKDQHGHHTKTPFRNKTIKSHQSQITRGSPFSVGSGNGYRNSSKSHTLVPDSTTSQAAT